MALSIGRQVSRGRGSTVKSRTLPLIIVDVVYEPF